MLSYWISSSAQYRGHLLGASPIYKAPSLRWVKVNTKEKETYFWNHDNSVDTLFENHSPEITDSIVQGILRNNKRLGIVVALNEGGIYVSWMANTRHWL